MTFILIILLLISSLMALTGFCGLMGRGPKDMVLFIFLAGVAGIVISIMLLKNGISGT